MTSTEMVTAASTASHSHVLLLDMSHFCCAVRVIYHTYTMMMVVIKDLLKNMNSSII